MASVIKLAGKSVTVGWTQETLRHLRLRASKADIDPRRLIGDFGNPNKAEYAVTAFMWLILPKEAYRKYPTPEDLYDDIAEEDAEDNLSAIAAVIEEMAVDMEKKSTSQS